VTEDRSWEAGRPGSWEAGRARRPENQKLRRLKARGLEGEKVRGWETKKRGRGDRRDGKAEKRRKLEGLALKSDIR